MPPRRNILVIKHGALGDIIQAFDAFASLRAAHKHDHLAILTTPAFAEFFCIMPYFDEVLIDNRASIFNFREAWRIRKILRRDWNVIYDLQTSQRSTFYCEHIVKSGDDIKVISNARRSGAYRLPDMRHINNAERMLAIAVMGGCKKSKADLAWLTAKTRQNKNRLVLVPGCSPGRPQKRWPPGNFAGLARMFAGKNKNKNREVVMVGTAADRDAGDAVLHNFSALDDRIGKTSLAELAEIFAGAGLVIGNDTGPVFLAARIGTPTLMLMSRHTDARASAPVGAHAGFLQKDDIADISADEAFTAAMRLLQK